MISARVAALHLDHLLHQLIHLWNARTDMLFLGLAAHLVILLQTFHVTFVVNHADVDQEDGIA